MFYSAIIDVRRRDAITAGDTHLITLCDLVLANGVDGNPLAADDARTQALLELGRRFPDSHTTTRPCSRARATSTTCSGSRSGRRRNKSPSRAPPASRAPKRAPEGSASVPLPTIAVVLGRPMRRSEGVGGKFEAVPDRDRGPGSAMRRTGHGHEVAGRAGRQRDEATRAREPHEAAGTPRPPPWEPSAHEIPVPSGK